MIKAERNPDRDTQIDKNRLDDEWLEQPKIIRHWTEQAAEARRDFEHTKADLVVVKAEVARAARSDPESVGLAKITEAAIAEYVPTDKRVRKAEKMVIDARYEMEIMDGFVEAMQHRKKALENAVELFLSGYFAEPRAKSPDAKDRMRDAQKKHIRKGRTRRDREPEDMVEWED